MPAPDGKVLEVLRGGGSRVSRIALFFFLAAAGCAADLVSKSLLFGRFYSPLDGGQEVHWIVGGVLGVQLSFNAGALFGIGHGMGWLFVTVSFLFLVLIAGWLLSVGWRDLWMVVAAGLVTGGILGNLHDRLGWGFAAGYPESARNSVRDWVYFRLEGVPMFDPWPNFNIADSCLVVGAGLILIHALFRGGPQETATGDGDSRSP